MRAVKMLKVWTLLVLLNSEKKLSLAISPSYYPNLSLKVLLAWQTMQTLIRLVPFGTSLV